MAGCSLSPPGSTQGPEEVFAASRPAVVVVEADTAVDWSVPQPALTPAKERQLLDQARAVVRAAGQPPSQSAVAQTAVRLLVDSPAAWFATGAQRHRQTDTVVALGTGFFATEDGYLLTNDHVVETSDAQVRSLLMAELDRQVADPAQLRQFRDDTARGLGAPVSDTQAASLYRWMVGVFKSDLQVSAVRPSYRIGFGRTSAHDVQSGGEPVRLVAHGQPVPGRDVALLKADGGPFVSLDLAASATGASGELAVIGYPCRCADDASADLGRTLAPVLTRGSVTGWLPMSGGWRALATDAHIEHGNSGGPVLDARGRVVGLATFVDAGPAGAAPGRSFAVPVELARQLAGQARVRLAQGPLGRAYAQAVADFWQQRYREALPLFEKVAGATSRDPSAQQYAAESRRAIAGGRDRTPAPAAAVPYVLAGLYVSGSLAAAAFAVRSLLRRRRRRGL